MPMPCIQLTATKLVSNGCFLLDDGEELLMWIGRGAPGPMLAALFGDAVTTLDGVDTTQLSMVRLDATSFLLWLHSFVLLTFSCL
jgi:protein transport protein SEC24